MDTEEDPFETPLEKEYNRMLEEMAKQREECATRIEELQRKIGSHVERAGDQNGGKGIPSGDSGGKILDPGSNATHTDGGHQGGHLQTFTPVVHHVDVHRTGSNISFTHSGNDTNIPSSGVGNSTVFHSSGAGNFTPPTLNDDPVLPGGGGGCIPCPKLPDVSDPCGRDSPSVLVTPEAVLLGAAATFILFVLAAAVAIIIRYLDNFTSGFLIVVIIVLVWYCSSMYPEAARRLGARVWGALRSGVSAVVERLFRRDHPEVGVKVLYV
jgi:hypothetical protein